MQKTPDPALTRKLKRGSRGREVRLVQEWLTLQGLHVVVDGDFGPATELAVRDFQEKSGLVVRGVVDKATFELLVAPMTRALAPVHLGGQGLGAHVVACADQHSREHPREVGGENMGPWVRLYMKGHQGSEWPWCAGFASFVLRQACDAVGVSVPLRTSFSCDVLAANAKERGLFVSEKKVTPGTPVPLGSIFLVRRKPSDWVHTGVVVGTRDDVLETIEGNTNDRGSPEGFEVCRRYRSYAKKDFILIQ